MLAPMIDMVKENTGGVAETTLGDKGYSAGEDLAEAKAKGYNVLANLKKDVNPKDGEKPFHTSRFVYDSENDCLICPLGKQLKFSESEGISRTIRLDEFYTAQGTKSARDGGSAAEICVVERSGFHSTTSR